MMPKDGPPDGEYTVYGYISTKDAQRPLPGATVTLSGVGTTTTTSTGFYRFDNVAPGTYTLSASAPTHTTTSDTITVTSAPLQHDIALTGHYTLNITVKDSETLQPVTNATVISLSDGQQADHQNPATFPVDYGTYTITATAEGYLSTQQYQYIDKVGETNATVLLAHQPTHAVYGYISTKDAQRPLPGVPVTLSGVGTTTTTSAGFYRFDNITPGTYTLNASAPNHDPLSDTITVTNAPLQHDIALTGHYTLNITVKDSETLQLVTNATVISLSDGQGANDQNPATFPVDYGPYTITVTAEGYLPTQQYQYIDKVGETNTTVILTPEPPPPEMPNYPPHSVRFLCIDEYNRPLQNVTIHAVYQESSSPVDWLADWLGISPKVKVNNTAMEGTTGLDGSVVFLMVSSVQYRITVTAPAPLNMTKTFDIYPKDDQVTIRFQTSPGTDLSAMPAYDLTATETDPSTVRLALTYNDTTNATTHLAFQVYDHATGDLIHTQTFDASKFPGTVSPSYDVSNTNGAMYRFGFTAQNSAHGEISQYKGITLRGDNLLVDLGFEDRTLYQWLAVLLLFLFAGAFSGTNVKQGAILVPLFGGGLFWFIGWLPITLGATISAIGFLGVLLYMRKSEWKVRA
ncbi:MAG TPA: carboxypeptidase regulatory-like domain-containing protein [Corynebacteriales bacterium]|nr:carboxypeptidase regulatory-like domain-containing protein [Mycobacteriales bacterium]